GQGVLHDDAEAVLLLLVAEGLLGGDGAAGEALLDGDAALARLLAQADVAGDEEGEQLVHALGGEAAHLREDLGPLLAGLAVEAEGAALAAGGAEADDAVVAGHVLADLGADPVAGVGGEAGAAIGIEVLDGLQEPEVALLDEVLERGAPAPVLEGDDDDGVEAALDQAGACPPVSVLVGERELALAVGGEAGPPRHLGAVVGQGAFMVWHNATTCCDKV